MKKLLFILSLLPFLIFAQTDTTQNRIVVSEDVNECIQEIYRFPDGIGMLARKIVQDKNKMQALRDQLIDDPAVHDMIRSARENMRSRDQEFQSDFPNPEGDNENDLNNPDNNTRIDRDINTCIDMVYDNPDALKLLLSIVLSDPEKTREAHQQVRNIPEFQEAARQLHSKMGDSDFDQDEQQDQEIDHDDTQLNQDPETNRIDTTGEKSMYLDDPEADSDTLRVK